MPSYACFLAEAHVIPEKNLIKWNLMLSKKKNTVKHIIETLDSYMAESSYMAWPYQIYQPFSKLTKAELHNNYCWGMTREIRVFLALAKNPDPKNRTEPDPKK